jgi:UDP-N-acetylglucosamine 2-epimerase (non-hydrolysing)
MREAGSVRVLFAFGTRPEAIKLAPVIHELRGRSSFQVRVCVTAQHRQLLDQVLRIFEIKSDHDLNLMRPDQDLYDITTDGLRGLGLILAREKPDLVIVQGDATSAFVAALAAFYEKIPVAHVESGLRTYNLLRPFPEEGNRVLVDHLARWLFAPTEQTKQNLLREGVAKEKICVTGNTAIDALQWVLHRQGMGEKLSYRFHPLAPGNYLVLVTSHRREHFGQEFQQICLALHDLVTRNKHMEIVYPVHPNPNIRGPVQHLLGNVERLHLIEPLDYASFVHLMRDARLILTDSGGIQEEAPALHVPVLVLRKETERIEALEAGATRLVGTEREPIVRRVEELLSNQDDYQRMASAASPYGDGQACRRIGDVLEVVYKKEAL